MNRNLTDTIIGVFVWNLWNIYKQLFFRTPPGNLEEKEYVNLNSHALGIIIEGYTDLFSENMFLQFRK